MSERRTERQTANFTASELVEVERAAAKARQSLPEFMRAAVLEAAENPPLTSEERLLFRRVVGAVKAGVPAPWEMT